MLNRCTKNGKWIRNEEYENRSKYTIHAQLMKIQFRNSWSRIRAINIGNKRTNCGASSSFEWINFTKFQINICVLSWFSRLLLFTCFDDIVSVYFSSQRIFSLQFYFWILAFMLVEYFSKNATNQRRENVSI